MTDLTLRNVKPSTRVMLPAEMAFFLSVGANLLITEQDRLRQTPGFRYADNLIDLHAWGIGYLGVGIAIVAAILSRSRPLARGALGVAAIWMGAWSCLLIAAAIQGDTSPTAAAWPLFVAASCWATLVSLAGDNL